MAAKRGERWENVVRIDVAPRERKQGDLVDSDAAASRRAVAQPLGSQQRERSIADQPARWAKACRLEPARPHRGQAAGHVLALLGLAETVPVLMAPRVVAALMTGADDRPQGLRIGLGVDALDEERRSNAGSGELGEDNRQRGGDRVMASCWDGHAQLLFGGLAEVVECNLDCGACTPGPAARRAGCQRPFSLV